MSAPIVRISLSAVGGVDLVPRAIISVSLAKFQKDTGVVFDEDQDDLDVHAAMYFRIGRRTCAFIHYRGEPDECLTVYMERNIGSNDAEQLLNRILREHGLSADKFRGENLKMSRASDFRNA